MISEASVVSKSDTGDQLTPQPGETASTTKNDTVEQALPGSPTPETPEVATVSKIVEKKGGGHVTTEIDSKNTPPVVDTTPTDQETTNKRLSTSEEDLLLKELMETAEPLDPIQTQLAVQRKRRTTTVTEETVKENRESLAEFHTENQNTKETELPLSSAWAEEKTREDALRVRQAAAAQKTLQSGN